MRVLVIGAGPAGLALGHALRRQRSLDCDVTILERRAREEPLGWGITLHPATMPSLGERAVGSYVDITPFTVRLDGRVVRTVSFLNHGISRQALRDLLLAKSLDGGVRIEFGVDGLTEPTAAARHDLVVGCDGAKSAVRSERLTQFQPKIEYGRNKFIWLGSEDARGGMRVNVRRVDDAILSATSYPYSRSMSTVIVECSAPTWTKLGFDTMTVEDCVGALSSIFREDLGGRELLQGVGARWQFFPCITNQRWAAGNVTLLGDALHTTHFSMGVGTRLALGDARVLSDSLRRCQGDVARAFRMFEDRRRPIIESAQTIALEGMRWSEALLERENAATVETRLAAAEGQRDAPGDGRKRGKSPP